MRDLRGGRGGPVSRGKNNARAERSSSTFILEVVDEEIREMWHGSTELAVWMPVTWARSWWGRGVQCIGCIGALTARLRVVRKSHDGGDTWTRGV